ncbi:class I SAM-dependent methyltransferase [Candidatus Woesearchaeota archaeon]|nr:class I SAM-dependent methyltransferase [Candidatus Woesearchaeota archaeon]
MNYNNLAKSYNELHKEEQLNKLRIIKNHIDIKKSDRLLDVGCGTGISFGLFNCNCYGIDPSKELVKQYNGEAKITIAEAESIPYPDNFFDIIISVTAMHNFEDIKKAIEEIRRVGKDKFAFSVLKNSKNYFEIRELLENNFKIKKIIEERKDLVFII